MLSVISDNLRKIHGLIIYIMKGWTIKAMSKVGRPKKEEAGDGDLPE
jgi:hypothetical protein